MRFTIVLGIIYLAILKVRHPWHRTPAAHEQLASIVWGSLVSKAGDSKTGDSV